MKSDGSWLLGIHYEEIYRLKLILIRNVILLRGNPKHGVP